MSSSGSEREQIKNEKKIFLFRAINNSCHFTESYIENSPLARHLLCARSSRRLLLFLLEWNSWIWNRWFRHLLTLSHLSNPMWKWGKHYMIFFYVADAAACWLAWKREKSFNSRIIFDWKKCTMAIANIFYDSILRFSFSL